MAIRGAILKSGISALVLAAWMAPASAQDAAMVANRVKALFANQGTEISWASISGSGASFMLEGVKAKITGQPGEFTVGNVNFDSVTEANGGYTIGKISLQDYNIDEGGMKFTMTGTTMENVVVPPEGSTDPLANMLFYDRANVASMKVNQGGKDVFTMDGLNFQMTRPTADQAMTFTGGAPTMTADLSGVTDPSSKQIIDALGYQTITGKIDVAGTWNMSDGKMAFTQYDTTVDNAGTFGMTFDLGGYTLDFMKQLQDLQKKMAEQPAGADNSAQGMAMLGLMQQLTFNSAAIKFTDDSLTNKVLDYVGKQQGVSGKDLANQVKAMVPFGMAQLNNPELTQQVTAAVSAFLDDPKSLTIKAAPAAPVPFAVLMAGGMGDPTSLPKTLGVTVTAND